MRPAGVLAVYLLSTSSMDRFPRGGAGLYSDSGSILYLLSTNENFVTKILCVTYLGFRADGRAELQNCCRIQLYVAGAYQLQS